MKRITLTITVLSISIAAIAGPPFKMAGTQYDELYDNLFTYLYINKFNLFKDASDIDKYKDYVKIENLLTGLPLKDGEPLPEFCILGFSPQLGINPVHKRIVLKSGHECYIIAGDDLSLPLSFPVVQKVQEHEEQIAVDSDLLMLDLSEAYEFFKRHVSVPEYDALFPVCVKIICDVFLYNINYE